MQRSVWPKFITPESFQIPLSSNPYSHPLKQRKQFFWCFPTTIPATVTICLFAQHTSVLLLKNKSAVSPILLFWDSSMSLHAPVVSIEAFFSFFSIFLKEYGTKNTLGGTGLHNLWKSREWIWIELNSENWSDKNMWSSLQYKQTIRHS